MTPRKTPPALRRHKPSKQAVVTLSGRDHYLGHWPAGQRQPPPDVQAAYDALIAEWLTSGRQTLGTAPPPLTISELVLQYWERYATVYYRHRDGSPTSEQNDLKLSLRPLRRLFGNLPAAEFSPLKLKAVRQNMIDSRLSRGVINQRIGRIKLLFKWAVGEELVPETTHRALLAVEGLKAGRSEAREHPTPTPAPDRRTSSRQRTHQHRRTERNPRCAGGAVRPMTPECHMPERELIQTTQTNETRITKPEARAGPDNIPTFYLGTHHPNWLRKTDVPLFISRRRLTGRKSLPRAPSSPRTTPAGGSSRQRA
jgi:hypothetical protein